jgi:hypothetical protein
MTWCGEGENIDEQCDYEDSYHGDKAQTFNRFQTPLPTVIAPFHIPFFSTNSVAAS